MLDNWRNLLALSVLVIPLAYCQIRNTEAEATAKIECFKQHGNWSSYYGGTCEFEKVDEGQ